MQPLGSDRVRIINDAYNASPDSMSAALRTLAQITGPGERTVAVLGAMSELGEYAEEEHDRVGLLAVRLGIQRIVVVGRRRAAHVPRGDRAGVVGRARRSSSPTADEAYDYLHGRAARRRPRAGQVLQLGGSAVPGRSSGRIVLVRSLLTAAAISLAFTLFLTPVFLRLFRKWGWGQVIRTPDDVHNPSHGEKRGTPTMGGTIFIVGTIVGYLVGAYTGNNPPTISGWLVVWMMVGFGAVGFIDDYMKVRSQRSLGLSRLAQDRRPGPRRGARSASSRSNFPNAWDQTPASPYVSVFRDVPMLSFMALGPIIGWMLYLAWISFIGVACSNSVERHRRARRARRRRGHLRRRRLQPHRVLAVQPGRAAAERSLSDASRPRATRRATRSTSRSSRPRSSARSSGSCGGTRRRRRSSWATSARWRSAASSPRWRSSPAPSCSSSSSPASSSSARARSSCSGVYFKLTRGKRLFLMSPFHHHLEMRGWSEITIVVRMWIIAGLLAVSGIGFFYVEWLAQT